MWSGMKVICVLKFFYLLVCVDGEIQKEKVTTNLNGNDSSAKASLSILDVIVTNPFTSSPRRPTQSATRMLGCKYGYANERTFSVFNVATKNQYRLIALNYEYKYTGLGNIWSLLFDRKCNGSALATVKTPSYFELICPTSSLSDLTDLPQISITLT